MLRKAGKKKIAVIMTFMLVFVFAMPQMKTLAADENGFEISAEGVLMAYSGLGGDITIPAGVTQIADNVFNGNATITSVVIPDGVTHIGGSAFANCVNMGSLSVSGTVSTIGGAAFSGCSSLSSVSYGSTTLPDSVFSGCNSLTSFSIPEGTTAVGANAFANCVNLSSVSVPASMATINLTAFSGCSNLTSVSAAGGNYSSSDGCLYNASMTRLLFCPQGKSSLSIPNSVVSIASGALDGCTHISSIEIPGSVTAIEAGAFSNSSVGTILIPETVSSIGSQSGWSVSLIRGNSGSPAEVFADSAGIPFEAIDGGDDTEEDPGDDFGEDPGETPAPGPAPTPEAPAPAATGNTTVSTGTVSAGGVRRSSTTGKVEPEIKGIDDSIPTKTIKIANDQEPFTTAEMEDIIQTNQTYNISFETEDGICIKFARGSMKLVDGMEGYDFRVRLILKYDRRTVDAAEMNENNFAFELGFYYDGEFPATAYVYIPIGTRYSGKTLYYYTCKDGTLVNVSSGTVDSDGYLIVSQNHCSDYVGLNEGIHVKDGTPKTGVFDYRLFLVLALAAVGAYFIVVRKRKVVR